MAAVQQKTALGQEIRIRLRAYDHEILDKTVAEIIDTARRTGARIKGPVPLPRETRKYTVLRSPHIDKKARDQFESRTYTRLLQIYCTPQTLDALMGFQVASEIEVQIKV